MGIRLRRAAAHEHPEHERYDSVVDWLTIRFGRPEDAEELSPIQSAADARFAAVNHPELARSETIPAAVADRAIEDGRLLVAEVGGRVVGWMYLTRSEHELCVGHLCVHPDYGRRGIGRALIRRLTDLASEAGERSIVLNTQHDVRWNRPWYESQGFEIVSEDQWTADMRLIVDEQTSMGFDWSTRVHMRLTLAADEWPIQSDV